MSTWSGVPAMTFTMGHVALGRQGVPAEAEGSEILLPALLRLFGRHAWALPRPLDRILPGVRSATPEEALRRSSPSAVTFAAVGAFV
jgi:hypothetical protein